MSDGLQIGVALLGAYLLGSIPFANIVARQHGLPDLRLVGDRNPGFWNAHLQIGTVSALPILLADTLKGAAAVGLMSAADPRWWLWYLAGGAALIGHAWPVFAGGRGGRSVLAFVGAMLIIAPLAAACALCATAVAWMVLRRFDVAVRIAMVTLPVAQITIDGPVRTAATGALMSFVGFRFLLAWRAADTDALAIAAASDSRS